MAGELHSGLHWDGVHLREQRLDEGQEVQLELETPHQIPIEKPLAELVHLPGDQVGENRNNPFAPQGQDGHHLVVVAGVEDEVIPAEVGGLRDLGDVPACLLYRYDVGVFAKLLIGFRLDVKAGAGGDII